MEIDKAIRESDAETLRTKYKNSIDIIQRALSSYSIEELAFSFNGGKDSTVVLHLLRAGYFLHEGGQNQNSPDGSLKDFPIRTIYFDFPCAFPEINSFTYDTAALYGLQIENIRLGFKSGLEELLKDRPIRAIFLGVRLGDPTAISQEQFSPSSPECPPFVRVNPILDWSYRDVWAFLLTCKVQYCCLYDRGYTSIGRIHDTGPNPHLSIHNSPNEFEPAYMLSDEGLERVGRAWGSSTCRHTHANSLPTASVIIVGDEILFGIVEDQLGPSLCRKLHAGGWSVSQVSVVRNNIDSVAAEVERKKSTCDVVVICGGVGPLHSDITLEGVAKAFGVGLARDEVFEEHPRHIKSDQCDNCNVYWNKVADLPKGISSLLDHDKLSVPLIKCQNVVVLRATNALELEEEVDCLIELTKYSDPCAFLRAYVSKNVATSLSDVEIIQPLAKLCLEYPDVHIGCYRKSRYGALVVSFKGQDQAHVESAVKALYKKFGSDAFMDVD